MEEGSSCFHCPDCAGNRYRSRGLWTCLAGAVIFFLHCIGDDAAHVLSAQSGGRTAGLHDCLLQGKRQHGVYRLLPLFPLPGEVCHRVAWRRALSQKPCASLQNTTCNPILKVNACIFTFSRRKPQEPYLAHCPELLWASADGWGALSAR